MSTKDNLLEAHERMAAVLDAKFSNLPEWQAFRAIDRALIELVSAEQSAHHSSRIKVRAAKPIRRTRQASTKLTYTELAARALEHAGAPIVTNMLVEFIGEFRPLHKNLKKARINVSSALSHDDRFESVPWQGGRAWWWSDRPIPETTAMATPEAA